MRRPGDAAAGYDRTQAEVAEMLGISQQAVALAERRAIAKLRRHLEEAGVSRADDLLVQAARQGLEERTLRVVSDAPDFSISMRMAS